VENDPLILLLSIELYSNKTRKSNPKTSRKLQENFKTIKTCKTEKSNRKAAPLALEATTSR
jgi:hypothetical protein